MDTKQRRRHQRGLDRIFYASPDDIFELVLQRGGAGSYPDAPSRRMACDADGTIGGQRRSAGDGALGQISAGNMTVAQDEEMAGFAYGSSTKGEYTFYIFPELRDLEGIFLSGPINNQMTEVASSGDTTNTWDGTWTQRIADFDDSDSQTLTSYRTEITSLAVNNVRGVRALDPNTGGTSKRLRAFHVYGTISAGETPDRLLWIDNDDDLEFSQPQDYGDVPRGSAEDHIVYLKNNSASLAANTVQVTAEDLFGGSGSWYTFDDGTGFSATKTLASSIGNGANSPDITIRRITPDAATLGVHAARAYVSVGSWT